MRLLFSTPYDVRMHLATLYAIALSDGKICHAEESYWNHLVSQYETKLGCTVDRNAIKHAASDKGSVDVWAASLRSRPCSARFFVKELVELVWRDGHFRTGEYEQLAIIANNCGVSIPEVDCLLMGVKAKMEAEEVVSQIVERGGSNLPLKQKEAIKRDRVYRKRIDLTKRISRWRTAFACASTISIFLFCIVVWLCVKNNTQKNSHISQNSTYKQGER